MLSWIFGILVLLLLGALALTIKLLKDVERGSRCQHVEITVLNETIDQLDKDLAERLGEVGELQDEVEMAQEALQDSKCRFGLLRKYLKATVEALQGRNFRSKREALERNKHFKQLEKNLKSL